MHPVFALSLQSTLKDVGALAGLVAIPGIAVLALLYFAQAREVKRLREWAGRAPERAAELHSRVGQTTAARVAPAQPARAVVSQPVSRPTEGGQARPPAQTPAGDAPGNAGGQPPPGAPRPATSAAGASPGGAAAKPAMAQAPAGSAAAAATSAPPRPVTTSAASKTAPANDRARSPEMAGAAGTGTALPPASATRPVAQPAAPGARTAAPLRTSTSSATIPPRSRGLLGRLGRRGAAIVSAVILALVVAGVFIFTQSGSGGTKAKSNADNGAATARTAAPAPKKRSGSPTAPVSRSQTTVSVLNGTTTPGLAANISDQLQRGGFKRGSVTNAADQQRPETLVNYAPGFKRAADEIAQLLKLKAAQPIDPGTQAIAGTNAQVVVTVGTDRNQ